MASGDLISVIDDDYSMRGALIALVRSAGYRVQAYASAEEFLEQGKIKNVACVVTDIQMPGMNGIELKHRLLASKFEMPVIMITALHDPGLKESAFAAGAFCFLRKPFQGESLIRCIEQALIH